MEHLINETIASQVREVFKKLNQPVKILFFGQKDQCEYCAETRQLLEEVTALSGQLSLDVFDLVEDKELAGQYKIDKAPGFALVGLDSHGERVDHGVRFFGFPYGNEFASLINSLILVSNHNTGLSKATRDFLKTLDQPVHLRVFSTPT